MPQCDRRDSALGATPYGLASGSMNVTREDLLRAPTLKRLGHVAFHLGLTASLARPMTAILGATPRGRLVRELEALGEQCGGRDLASLLAYGDDLLSAKTRQPLKTKLLALARSWLVIALEEGPSSPDAEHEPPPASLAELRKWASQNHVAALLQASVYRELNPTQPELFSGIVDAAVENGPFDVLIGDPELSQRTRIPGARLQRLRTAAWLYLQAQAKDATTAIAEFEASGLGQPPPSDDSSTRSALIRRAQACRAALGPKTVPRPKAKVHAEPAKLEDGTPPVFVHTEAPRDRYAFATRVRIALALDEPWAPTCSDHKGPCAHQLTALDMLLDRLTNGSDQEIAEIVDPVGLPDWSRGLKALDAILQHEDEPQAETECLVTWGVNLAGRRPEIAPWLQVPTKSGGWGKAKRLRPNKLLDGGHALDPDDRHIAELLELHALMPDPRSDRATRVLQRALQRLTGHPRVTRQPDGVPLTVRRGSLTLMTVRVDGFIRLMPAVDEKMLALDCLRPGNEVRVGRLMLLPQDDALVLVEVSSASEAVIAALLQHDFQLPERELPELIQRLPAFGPRVPVRLDRNVHRRVVPAQRRLILRLGARGRGLTVSATVRPLAGGPAYPPGDGPAELLAVEADGELVSTLRDRAGEIAWARERCRTLLVDAEPDVQPWRYALSDPKTALQALAAVQAADDVSVVWHGKPWQIHEREIGTSGLQLQVRDRRDWFGVGGQVDVDGRRVPLDGLVDAVRRDDDYVIVGDGQWARISSALRAQLAALEPHLRREDGELAVSPAATEALESLGAASADFVRSVRWRDNLERLEAARHLDESPPAGLKAELRDYQLAGFRWMNRLAAWGLGACLADDMGLGKTLQTLAVLTARADQGPQLVVAPTSVVYNWIREAERFAPDLTPKLYVGAQRAALLENLGPGDILVTSYGLLVRDLKALQAIRFASLALDEAQAIKNAQSQRWSAVRDLDADWRIALSGTPVENHLGELWAVFAAVAPGLLGGWNDFRDRFVVPIERDGHRSRAHALSQLIRPFVLRRTKQEVAQELPPRTAIDLDVVLTDAELSAYEQARTDAVAQLAGAQASQGRFQALAALTRLRQLACHPRLVDPESRLPSSKLARLMELVRNILDTGQRALVFSQFTKHLALVKEALDDAGITYLYLDGQTSAEDRAQRVARFQAGEKSLFLISLKAGGTGLTLTAADTVIHLDPWWNPAVEDQATDRAHRIGQTKPVTVYRLIAKGTIEEGILALHADKRALVAQVLEGSQTAGALSTDELIGLIRGGGRPT